jgi:hypothetical protein
MNAKTPRRERMNAETPRRGEEKRSKTAKAGQ